MGGNIFGTLFRVMTFGESHGKGLGCVVDGCPAGLALAPEDIGRELARRRPGGGGAASARKEEDEPEILSGVYDGKTLGTPIAILIRNRDQRSADYDNLKDVYRPGHADWPWEAKYGIRDHRGGGRSSARETAGRVAAGAIAKVFLASRGIDIKAWTSSAAGVDAPAYEREDEFNWNETDRNPLRMPGKAAAALAMEKIEDLKARGDSAGCAVSCVAMNLPAGLGEPVFDKLDARIAAAMLSLGAAKGIEFGAGFSAAKGTGSLLNDIPVPALPNPRSSPNVPDFSSGIPDSSPLPLGVPPVSWKTNNAGGVLGGLSTGADLFFTVAFKPISSIAREQETVNRNGEKTLLAVHGRHDVCVAPRAVPVVEAMCALVLADFLLLQRSARSS